MEAGLYVRNKVMRIAKETDGPVKASECPLSVKVNKSVLSISTDGCLRLLSWHLRLPLQRVVYTEPEIQHGPV